MGLVVYGEVGFKGPSSELTDNVVDIELVVHAGVPFHIKSAIVTGNPWIFYTQAKYQNFLMCAEEGRYEDLTGLPRIVSVKYKNMKFGIPHILLSNPVTLTGPMNWWTISDKKVECLSTGKSGLWMATADQKVFYRNGTGYDKGLEGTGWTLVPGDMKQVSVGNGVLWGVTPTNEVALKTHLSKDNPVGGEWQKMASSDVMMSSVSHAGTCWSIDLGGKVFSRSGAKASNPIGSKWQVIPGYQLKQISNGESGVWGVTTENEVVYRDGTFGKIDDTDGDGWTKVDGRFVWVASGQDIVWALTEKGHLWLRSGISTSCPTGSSWLKLDFGPDQDVAWKQVCCVGNGVVGLDKDQVIIGRSDLNQQSIIGGNQVSAYEAMDNFSIFNLSGRPSSCTILSGGWVIYSEKGFTGSKLYHFDDETICNDPSGGSSVDLKSWEEPIGSIRPIFGEDYRPTELRVDMSWSDMVVENGTELVRMVEEENPSQQFMKPANWQVVEPVNVQIDHRFILSKPSPECENAIFYIKNIPKGNILWSGPVKGKPQANNKPVKEAKSDFKQELSGPFTFSTQTEARRTRTRLENIKMFPKLSPNTKIKVSLICEKSVLSVPFTATLKRGVESWTISGTYKGVDATNVILDSQEWRL